MRVFRSQRLPEQGAGMVLVVGFSAIALSLMATALMLATTSLERSRSRSNYELALAAGEAGVDTVLARVKLAYDTDGSDFPVPGQQDGTLCDSAPISQSTSTDEATWAREELLALASAGCVEESTSGEFVLLKPISTRPSRGRIYAMGWAPSQDVPGNRRRLIKIEYQVLPYSPSHAILTEGSMELQSSSLGVTGASGSSPGLAGVHANGSITATGNPWVTGRVSSTEPSTAVSTGFDSNQDIGGSVAEVPRVTTPEVSAARLYRQAADLDPEAITSWRDLCPPNTQRPTFTVRPYSPGGPCTAPDADVIAEPPGISYDVNSATWTIGRTAADGVYYAHESNITSGTGNYDFANLTLIASAANATDCNQKQYGNIQWDHYSITAPALAGTFMVADADIRTHANFSAGMDSGAGSVQSGVIVAGDQIQLFTSSAGVVGSVITGDQCMTSSLVSQNVFQGVTIKYDPSLTSPFSSLMNQNLWLELASG